MCGLRGFKVLPTNRRVWRLVLIPSSITVSNSKEIRAVLDSQLQYWHSPLSSHFDQPNHGANQKLNKLKFTFTTTLVVVTWLPPSVSLMTCASVLSSIITSLCTYLMVLPQDHEGIHLMNHQICKLKTISPSAADSKELTHQLTQSSSYWSRLASCSLFAVTSSWVVMGSLRDSSAISNHEPITIRFSELVGLRSKAGWTQSLESNALRRFQQHLPLAQQTKYRHDLPKQQLGRYQGLEFQQWLTALAISNQATHRIASLQITLPFKQLYWLLRISKAHQEVQVAEEPSSTNSSRLLPQI